jgi:hypothetical protein
MSCRSLLPLAAVPFLVGCVPVTEPVGDVARAEPDKRLLGRWEQVDKSNDVYEIDVPAVKGNPKGLMRAVGNDKPDDLTNTFWFHIVTIGKHAYATVYLHPTEDAKFADFRADGAFETWQTGDRRRYFIFRFVLDGDKLDVDAGNDDAVKKLMEDEKVKLANGYFQTPAGWLAKYLEKDGPGTIFDGKAVDHRKRVKQ